MLHGGMALWAKTAKKNSNARVILTFFAGGTFAFYEKNV